MATSKSYYRHDHWQGEKRTGQVRRAEKEKFLADRILSLVSPSAPSSSTLAPFQVSHASHSGGDLRRSGRRLTLAAAHSVRLGSVELQWSNLICHQASHPTTVSPSDWTASSQRQHLQLCLTAQLRVVSGAGCNCSLPLSLNFGCEPASISVRLRSAHRCNLDLRAPFSTGGSFSPPSCS